MATHIDDLCRTHRVRLIADPRASGIACKQLRWIRVRPVTDDETYFVALHELGHVIAPGAGSGKYTRLVEEALAWQWAFANTLVPPSRRVNRMIHEALGSYVDRTQYATSMRPPPLGHLFWELLDATDPTRRRRSK